MLPKEVGASYLNFLPRLRVGRSESERVEAQVSGSGAGPDLVELTESFHREDRKKDLECGQRALGKHLLHGGEWFITLRARATRSDRNNCISRKSST